LAARRLDGADVTFINFGRGGAPDHGAERAVPLGREQGSGWTPAQAIGAFAAHADRSSGPGYAAVAGQDGKEIELALDGPAIVADAMGARTARLRIAAVHRPVWTTNRLL